MLTHDLPLFRGEHSFFAEDLIGNTYLAQVVEIASTFERDEALIIQAKMLAQITGVSRQSRAVVACVGITGFHAERQRKNHGFSIVELIGKFLQLQQRPDAREKFFWIKRLAEEVVGASFNAANAIVAITEAG